MGDDLLKDATRQQELFLFHPTLTTNHVNQDNTQYILYAVYRTIKSNREDSNVIMPGQL